MAVPGDAGGSSPEPAPPCSPAARRWAPALALLLLTMAAYATSFPGAYIYDDLPVVADNPLIESPSLKKLLTADWWGPGVNSRLHRPIALLTFAAVRLFFGPSAPPQHAANFLLHALLVLLLWRLWLSLGIPHAAAWLASAAFAVHPIHAEVVDMVVGRAEILAGLGIAAALWAFLAAPERARPWLLFPAFVLALLSKESSGVFPLLLFLADGWRNGFRRAVGERWRLHAGTSLVVLAWLGGRLFLPSAGLPTLPPLPVDNPLVALALPARLATIAKVQLLYLWKMIWPRHLAATYVAAGIGPIARPASAAGLALTSATAALALLCLWGWRRRLPFALGLAFHAAAFLVMSNLLFLTPFLMAERFAYLPSAGSALAMAAVVTLPFTTAIGRPGLRIAAGIAAGLWLAALAGGTLVRSLDFADPLVFWEREAARSPGNARAWSTLGATAARYGRDTLAEEAFSRAIAADRSFVEPYLAYALFLVDRARPDQAMLVLQPVLEEMGAASPLAMIVMARACLRKGSPAEALGWLDRTPETHRPREWWELRAAALDGLNRPADAALARERARQAVPVLELRPITSAPANRAVTR